MKRAVIASCSILFCCGVLLGASAETRPMSRERAPLLQDLVRMTRAGASDVTVLAYAKTHRLELPPEVSDQDLFWLRQSGVSELVVRYMTAVDVRASGDPVQHDVADGGYENSVRPRVRDSYVGTEDDSYGYGYPDRYVESYPDAYSGDYDYG